MNGHQSTTELTPTDLGLPQLLRAIVDPTAPGFRFGAQDSAPIDADRMFDARSHILAATHILKRLSTSLNARACDDDFDRPNAADIAVEELGLALESLS